MTTTEESPNYTRVAPWRPEPPEPPESEPASATGNGNESGTPEEAPQAQPRARARVSRMVAGGAAAVRRTRETRRVDLAKHVAPADVGDRPDLWHRHPLSPAVLWERRREAVGAAWSGEARALAVGLLLFTVLVEIPFTAAGYGIAFCSQEPHRAFWLVLALAAGGVLFLPVVAQLLVPLYIDPTVPPVPTP